MHVDFSIVGAQKSGTTALFKYLEKHPKIILPLNKEAPYFVDPNLYDSQNFSEYFSAYYDNKNKIITESQIGSISPQYMCYDGCAKRMAKHNHEMKIIALLREPISRSISHYKMNVRRGLEQRDYSAVLKDALSREIVLPSYSSNEMENERKSVLLWSMYGTALTPFFDHFPLENMLLIGQSELINNPQKTYSRICNFINVDQNFVPANLGKKYHIGGTSTFLPRSEEFAKIRVLKKFWHSLPKKTRVKIAFWYGQLNIRTDNAETKYIVEDDLKKEAIELIRDDLGKIPSLKRFIELWFEEG